MSNPYDNPSTSNKSSAAYSHPYPGVHYVTHQQMQQPSQQAASSQQQQAQQLQDHQLAQHSMKDASGYDLQPRFYTSPMVLQQPSYFPQNSQYTFNQSIVYPPNFQQQIQQQQVQQAQAQQLQQAQAQQQQAQQQQAQQAQQQQAQQLQQQQVAATAQQQYFDSVPVNNYMLIPNNASNYTNTNASATINSTAAAGSSAPVNATSPTPIPAATTINSFYPNNYNQPVPPHHMAHHQVAPPPPPVHQTGASAKSEPSNAGSGGAGSTPAVLYPNFPERLQQLLPAPPLSRAPARPDMNLNMSQKRAKRKSKFSKYQDELIVSLKKKGKSWVEIAEATNVGSYLAARNRYQVIVGQQGNNNSSSWDVQDKIHLQQILDAGELEKWRFISLELNKATKKNFSAADCRELIRLMFWSDPASFGVTEDTINECLKEKKLTEKILEQRDQSIKKKTDKTSGESAYVEPMLNAAKLDKDIKKENLGDHAPENSAHAKASQVHYHQQVNPAADTTNTNYFTASASHPQPLPHPYQRGLNAGSASYPQASAAAAQSGSLTNNPGQYSGYPKHYY